LIAEDDFLQALEAADAVQSRGAHVVGPFSDPEEALQRLETERVDVGLLDISLTGCNSFGIAAALEERQIPFVFFTCCHKNDIPPEYRAVPFYTKPHSRDEMVRIVALALSRSR
jgi:DNA-binding NarL/FixJ family response regulator